jgi:hypothetical protein
MPNPGDDTRTWDVLPSPTLSEPPALALPDLYQPPAEGDPDPITVVGEPDRPGRRFRGLLFRVAPLMLLLCLLLEVVAAFNMVWMVIIGVIVAAFLVWTLVLAARRPVWTPPRLELNSETFTVTDVEGVTRSVAWTDVGRLRLTVVFDGDVDGVHLTWISPGGGADSSANLGNTLKLDAVSAAIKSRIPHGPEFIVGPRRAVKRRWG